MKRLLLLLFLLGSLTQLFGESAPPRDLEEKAFSGDAVSQNTLGIFYLENGDMDKALEWWQKAANQGYVKAYTNLGSYYLMRNQKEAKYWYEKGAEHKDPLAYRGLAMYYDKFEHNTEETLKWYRMAANCGDTNSQRVLGFWHYRQGQYHTAISYFSPAVQKGDELAQRGLADSYYELKDYPNAFKWYVERANHGDIESQNRLAYMYIYGQGTDVDHKEGRYWMKRSAEGGNPIAQFNLGLFYSKGSIGLEQNEEKSFEWFKKAADQGYSEAMYNVGVYYYNHGERDKAFHWLSLAKEKGYADAEKILNMLR